MEQDEETPCQSWEGLDPSKNLVRLGNPVLSLDLTVDTTIPDRSGPQRHHSISDYDAARPGSSHNLQNYYANQRFQPRQSEAEQAMQQKRRMAAQRERELRNYHQEQQYNRSKDIAKLPK